MALMYRKKLDRKKHVFTDWSMVEPGYAVSWSDALGTEWETPKGISLKVLKPRIETEPMVELEHPWETGYTLHTTILDDDGRHKLYYTCYNQLQSDAKTEGEQNPYTYYLCYAESEDGVSWTKPTIGTVNWRGSTENNIVYGVNRAMGRPVPTATVFKDPSAPPNERYKIIHRGKEEGRPLGCVFGATSPDGIDWTPIEEPLLKDYNSDTQVVARFDEEIGKYRGFFRGRRPVDGESPQIRRTIAYAETEDFNHWPRPETVVTTDVYDHPGTDIYTNGYTVWPDADAHLMFPAFYQREMDVMAVQLLTSRDGYNWERHTREPLIDGGDQGTSGDPRRDYTAGFYAGVGVVSMRPDESSIALVSNRRSHNNNRANTGESDTLESLQQTHYPSVVGSYSGQIRLATWPKDGFVCVDAPEEGYFATTPFVFEGGTLKINGWSRYRGGINVELADASNEHHTFSEPVTGRGFDNADEILGTAVDHTVTWNGQSDLSQWEGKPVRLRFKMRRSRLNAIWFE